MRSLSTPFAAWTACLAASVAIASPLQALEVSPTEDAATLVAQLLGESGFDVVSQTFTGAAGQAATYKAGPLGLADGVLISSGLAADAVPPNDIPGKGQNMLGGSDDLCKQLAPTYTFYDAARLDVKFKVKSGFNGLHLEYVVGSEEYPEFVGQQFNDIVGVFIDGKNVALDAEGNVISINGPFFAGSTVITESGTQFDGATPRLAVDVALASDVAEHTLTIVVCDAGDGTLDTALFLSGLTGCKDCASVDPGKTTWCGDGAIDPGNEECDDGNNVDNDACTNACKKFGAGPECGDGKLDDGEQCDDGNKKGGDGCSAACVIEGPPAPVCGNEVIEAGEQCDDGNTDSGDGCDSECKIEEKPAVCGDGVCTGDETHGSCPADCGPPGDPINCAQKMCPAEFAACATDKDCGAVLSCMTACADEDCFKGCFQAAAEGAKVYFEPLGACAEAKKCQGGVACGDGKKTAGEQCDDGNNVDGDGCSATCMTEGGPAAVCGNMMIEGSENCDDGNKVDGDGCSAICQVEGPTSSKITPTDDPDVLRSKLLGGTCFTTSDKKLDAATGAAATFTSGPLGLADGILLSSGLAMDAAGPNDQPGKGFNHNRDGNELCKQLAPGFTFYDAARFDTTFKVTTGVNGLHLEFVVGSEEYPEYVGQSFNDVVGIFVDGKNVALDPKGNLISINGPFFSGDSVITNSGTQFDGTTPRLSIDIPIDSKAESHTVSVVVCDAGDGALDTAVFLSGLTCCTDCVSTENPGKTTWCGDGTIDPGSEQCDDGNNVATDGCDNACKVIPGWTCEGEPSVCQNGPSPAKCGNGKKEGAEQCDDGNTTDGDGCSKTCTTETIGAAVCGDGKKEGAEQCDDGNKTAGDGCDAACKTESIPAAICGNSKVESGETCDDGNKTAGDGCSATCQTEDATAYPPGSIQLLGGGCTAAPAGSTSGGGLWAVLGLLAALLMVRLRRAPQAAWLVLVALIAAPNAYAADGGYSLQRFRAQTSTQGLLHSEGAKILDAWTPAVGLWLHDDEQPLTVSDAATGKKLYDEVGRQISAQLVAALGLFGFAELGVAIPVVLNQSGEDRPAGLGTAPSLGAGTGDIRLIPKVKLLHSGGLNVALSAAFDLPTASAAYSGDDGVGVEPRLNASFQDTSYGALVGLGTRVRPSFSPTITGSNQSIKVGNEAQATLGGWVNVVPETLDLLVDSRFAVNLEQQDAEERSGEVLGGVRLHLPAELVVTAAAGPGFGQSPGTPALRAVLGLMWAPDPGRDTDGDGIVDKQDKCPKVAEDKDGFEDGDGCLDADNDQDGILDVNDKCPLDPEDKDQFEDENGCPDPDNDKDGILDVNDKCPLDPEDKDQFEDENGCPDPDNDKDGILDVDDKCPIEFGVKEEEGCPVRDRDGDGYPDKTDKCPDKPESFNGIEDEDGCPDKANKVEVTETEIKILDKVYFDTAKATIKPVSFPILDAVASVLKSTPRVGKVRVEGHTDDVDTDENNNRLSQARAESVVAYLVNRGIAPERLVARGFGESKPLCKDTPDLLTKGKKAKKQLDACRETNRRVQFKLLEMNGKTLPEDQDPQTIETSRPAK